MAYRETGAIRSAAEAAKVGRTTVYDWRERSAEFRTAFEEAQEDAVELLETEARRRAINGTRRYRFHEGRPIKHPVTGEPYFELVYSDTLLIFLLKGLRPEKYRERFDVSGDTTGTLRLDLDTVMSEHGLRRAQAALDRGAAGAKESRGAEMETVREG